MHQSRFFWVKIRLHLIWQANYSPSSKSNWTLLMLKKGVLPRKWRRAISRNNMKRIYISPFTVYFADTMFAWCFIYLESWSRLHEYNYTWMVYLQFHTNQNLNPRYSCSVLKLWLYTKISFGIWLCYYFFRTNISILKHPFVLTLFERYKWSHQSRFRHNQSTPAIMEWLFEALLHI